MQQAERTERGKSRRKSQPVALLAPPNVVSRNYKYKTALRAKRLREISLQIVFPVLNHSQLIA